MLIGTSLIHIGVGDSQKVNCPDGAREATLGCGALPLGMADLGGAEISR